MSTAVVIAVYAFGWVAALIFFARLMESEFGRLDGWADVAAACFFAMGWPIYLPFVPVVWVARRFLRSIGVEVKS